MVPPCSAQLNTDKNARFIRVQAQFMFPEAVDVAVSGGKLIIISHAFRHDDHFRRFAQGGLPLRAEARPHLQAVQRATAKLNAPKLLMVVARLHIVGNEINIPEQWVFHQKVPSAGESVRGTYQPILLHDLRHGLP